MTELLRIVRALARVQLYHDDRAQTELDEVLADARSRHPMLFEGCSDRDIVDTIDRECCSAEYAQCFNWKQDLEEARRAEQNAMILMIATHTSTLDAAIAKAAQTLDVPHEDIF